MSRQESPLNIIDELLVRRRDDISPHDSGLDKHINVAFDGGGTGGIVGLGMADVLYNEGLLKRANSFSGVSIGAHLATVAITGQIEQTKDFLVDGFTNNDFIKPSRLLRGKPMVDLNILEKALYDVPLDFQKLSDDERDIFVGVTRLRPYGQEIWSKNKLIDPNNPARYVGALMATVHLPRVAGKPPMINGAPYADGGMATVDTPHIAFTALRDIDTDQSVQVLNIANKPKPSRSIVNHEFTGFVAKWMGRHGEEQTKHEFRRFSRVQAAILNSPDTKPIQRLYPDTKAHIPEVLSRDPELLRKGFIAGQNAAMLAIGMSVGELEPKPDQRRSFKQILGDKALKTIFSLAP